MVLFLRMLRSQYLKKFALALAESVWKRIADRMDFALSPIVRDLDLVLGNLI
jgi:hypothetical protein